MMVLGAFFSWLRRKPAVIGILTRATHLLRNANVPTKMKILVTFYQIATKVPSIYDVALPPSSRAILESFGFVVDLGLDVAVTPLECFGLHGFLPKLVFVTVMPALFVTILVLYGAAKSLRGVPMRTSLLGLLPLVLKLLFAAYPIVSTVAFQAFDCESFDVGTDRESSRLRADYSVQCTSESGGEFTSEYAGIRCFATFAVLLYPLGIPVGYAVLLMRVRHTLLGHAKPTPLSKALSFLHAEYKPRFFWWELFETLRRFVLVGVAVVCWSGTLTQLSIGASVTLVFLIVQMQARPLRQTSDEFVSLSASFALVLLFFCCVLLKVGTVSELEALSGSTAIREKFSVPTAYLSIVLILSVLGSLIFASLLLAYQIRDERKAALHAAAMATREAKAKRLRYADGTPVVLGEPGSSGGSSETTHTLTQDERSASSRRLLFSKSAFASLGSFASKQRDEPEQSGEAENQASGPSDVPPSNRPPSLGRSFFSKRTFASLGSLGWKQSSGSVLESESEKQASGSPDAPCRQYQHHIFLSHAWGSGQVRSVHAHCASCFTLLLAVLAC